MKPEYIHEVKEWVFTSKVLNSYGRLMVGSQNQPVFPLCSFNGKRLFSIRIVNKDRTRKNALKTCSKIVNFTEIRGRVDCFNKSF